MRIKNEQTISPLVTHDKIKLMSKNKNLIMMHQSLISIPQVQSLHFFHNCTNIVTEPNQF